MHGSSAPPTLVGAVTETLDRLPGRRVLEEAVECPGCGEGSWTTLRRHVTADGDPACVSGLLEPGDEVAFEMCGWCGLVFLSPRYSADTLARYYGVPLSLRASRRGMPADRDTNPRYARRERARFARLARLVRHHSPTAKIVVDLGANDGASLRPFLDGGARAIAIEPGLDAGIRADSRLEARPSLEALKEDGIEPDVVLSTQTFEHLPSPRAMARSALEAMGDGGVLVVEVPYELLWMGFLLDSAEPVSARHSEHLNFFTSDSLARMAASWGASVIDVSVGAQIQMYGGLIPSITLIARASGPETHASPGASRGSPEPLAETLARDRGTVRRAQQRLRILSMLARRGRW
jgi:Methyltransferase domain